MENRQPTTNNWHLISTSQQLTTNKAFTNNKDISGNDLGFGNKATENNQQVMNRDGSSDINEWAFHFFEL